MAYQLQILAMIAGTEPGSLLAEASAAISANGYWERFCEVRLAAGPTVRVTAISPARYDVSVSWGAQDGRFKARTLLSAIECADRLACAFYEMRDARLIQD